MIYTDKDDTRFKAQFLLDMINRGEKEFFGKGVNIYRTGVQIALSGENLEMLTEILERHTPTKVVGNNTCPNCGKGVLIDLAKKYRPSFCFSCGQALDWENIKKQN